MALTTTVVKKTRSASHKVHYLTATFPASYTAGGEAFAPASFGMSAFLFVGIEQDADGYVVKFDRAANKLMVFEQGIITGSTTVADATTGALIEDGAGAETTFRAMGTAVDTTIRVGALKEAAATTDLSAVSVRLQLIGV